MKRKIARGEMRETVLNLIDLGFTVSAVASMLGKTQPNIYAHLKSSKRMAKREIIRRIPVEVTPGAKAAIRKVFAKPNIYGGAMLVLAMAREER